MRPDFGAGLLALVFEPNSTHARRHHADAGAERAAAAPVAPDRGAGRRGRATSTPRLQVDVRYTVLLDGTRAQRQLRGAGRRAMRYPLLRPAPARSAAKLAARPTPSSSSRCSTTPRPPAALRQRTLFVRLLRAGLHARRRTTCASTAASASATVGIVWCAPADALPPQAEPGLVDTRRRPAAHAGGPHRQRRRLLALHAAHRRAAPAATSRRRTSIRCCRRSSSRSRSNARRTSTAPRPPLCPPDAGADAATSTTWPRTTRASAA